MPVMFAYVATPASGQSTARIVSISDVHSDAVSRPDSVVRVVPFVIPSQMTAGCDTNWAASAIAGGVLEPDAVAVHVSDSGGVSPDLQVSDPRFANVATGDALKARLNPLWGHTTAANNCVAGMLCPNCFDSTHPSFEAVAHCTVQITDDGAEGFQFDWSESPMMTCRSCGYNGDADEFDIPTTEGSVAPSEPA